MKLASEMLNARQALITDKFTQLQEVSDDLKRQRQDAYAQHQGSSDGAHGTDLFHRIHLILFCILIYFFGVFV
jgi:hypothetical protein